MAVELKWLRQGPVAFSADGGADGLVTVEDVLCFKVKQDIVISSDTQPNLQLEVKRVLSLTQLIVGPRFDSKNRRINQLNKRTDISAYTVADNASIRASEQDKKFIPTEDMWKAVYEFEPTLALRNLLVDKVGSPHSNKNPLWTGLTDGNNNAAINNDGSINVNIVEGGAAGSNIVFTDTSGEFTDTTETQVATYVSDQNNTRITKFLGEAPTFGWWRIYKNAVSTVNLTVSFRTSPFQRNGEYDLEIPETLSGTDTLIVTFQADRYRSNLLGSTASTFVRLEGVK